MADIVVDGYNRVDWVPTIASATLAPTAAEYLAGTRLDTLIVGGGMEGYEASPGEVDNTYFSSRFDTKIAGVSSYSGTRLIMKKQTIGTDPTFDTLTAFGTNGFIVVRYGVVATATRAAAQKVTVYPTQTGDWDWMAPERNSLLKYWVAMPITAEPGKNLAVLA